METATPAGGNLPVNWLAIHGRKLECTAHGKGQARRGDTYSINGKEASPDEMKLMMIAAAYKDDMQTVLPPYNWSRFNLVVGGWIGSPMKGVFYGEESA